MPTTKFFKDQDLKNRVFLLDELYGSTQNYSKNSYEIYTHLNEVCGIFGRYLFKEHDIKSAADFLPKIFAWAVALLKTVNHENHDLEEIILRKFPLVCPYCGNSPCSCPEDEKPSLDQNRLRIDYYRNSAYMDERSANDFQLMFQKIYGNKRGDEVGYACSISASGNVSPL